MSPGRPSLSARLRATLRGDVPADEVLARLAASGGVYEDYLAAETLRNELAAAGIDPWTTAPAESSQLLCVWNAHALVSLAQAFVDAEGVDPSRGGFLPQVTAEQALRFLREVPAWVGRARRAAAEPGYDVAAEVWLPAPLPPWMVVEPCPRSHLAAMQAAGGTMLQHIEASLADLIRLSSAGASAEAPQLRGMAIQAQSRLEYANGLLASAPGAQFHEGIEQALRESVTACYLLGQVLARPQLRARAVAASSPRSAPTYGTVGYGPPPPPPWGRRGGHGYDGGHGHHH